MVPDPPLVQRAARKDVRLRWVGRYVRFSRKLLMAPSPEDPDIHELQLRQQDYNSLGYGRILDVGKSGWFLIRWENGSESQECKRALDFYKDEATVQRTARDFSLLNTVAATFEDELPRPEEIVTL